MAHNVGKLHVLFCNSRVDVAHLKLLILKFKGFLAGVVASCAWWLFVKVVSIRLYLHHVVTLLLLLALTGDDFD